MRAFVTALVTGCVLTGCAAPNPCEEILEVKRQNQQCQEWRRVMNDKRYPQQALTAKKRFEEACQGLRYYRDQYDTICRSDEAPVGQRKEQ